MFIRLGILITVILAVLKITHVKEFSVGAILAPFVIGFLLDRFICFLFD